MNSIIDKLRQIEARASADRGPFCLFALLLPENAVGGWDVVAAAPWAEADQIEAMQYLAGLVQEMLTREEIVALSRVAVISCDAEDINRIEAQDAMSARPLELHNQTLFGLRIDTAYVLTARRSADGVCA